MRYCINRANWEEARRFFADFFLRLCRDGLLLRVSRAVALRGRAEVVGPEFGRAENYEVGGCSLAGVVGRSLLRMDWVL